MAGSRRPEDELSTSVWTPPLPTLTLRLSALFLVAGCGWLLGQLEIDLAVADGGLAGLGHFCWGRGGLLRVDHLWELTWAVGKAKMVLWSI